MTHSEVSMVLALFGSPPPLLSSRALCVHLILDHDLQFESTCQVSARKRKLFCDFKMQFELAFLALQNEAGKSNPTYVF